MTDLLRITETDGTRWVRFGNDDRPTVLSPELIAGLTAAVEDAGDDEALRAVVLRGADRWFCVGADLSVYKQGTDRDARAYLVALLRLFRTMWDSPKVIVAAVSGLALGGGAELALWSDLRLCREDAQLGFPEVSLGTIPGGGGVQLLGRLIGLSAATELLLTGQRVDGRRAREIGLAHASVPPVHFDEHVASAVARLAALSPISLAMVKRALHVSIDSSLEAALSNGLDVMHLGMFLGDAVEGIEAFFERRPPSFGGRVTRLFNHDDEQGS